MGNSLWESLSGRWKLARESAACSEPGRIYSYMFGYWVGRVVVVVGVVVENLVPQVEEEKMVPPWRLSRSYYCRCIAYEARHGFSAGMRWSLTESVTVGYLDSWTGGGSHPLYLTNWFLSNRYLQIIYPSKVVYTTPVHRQ